MRAWIALVCFMLAGCSGEPAPDVDAVEPTAGAPEPGNATAPPSNETIDLPPVAHIAADVLNGTAPLWVNLTLNATDPEGKPLSWSLDPYGNGTFAHNGTQLPATVAIQFSSPGNHTALLVVRDGNHTAEARLTVHVLEAATPPYQHAEGAVPGHSLVCHGAPDTDTGGTSVAIDPATWGQPFTLTFRSGAAHVAYAFQDAAGTEQASGSGGLSGGGWAFSGNVPEASAQLLLYACENTFDETFTYDAGTPP